MHKIIFAFLLLLISALLLPFTVMAQAIPYYEYREIIDLYTDGQYNIVKAKLENYGFVVTKSIPDYTLNGMIHAGDFTMTREKESPYEDFRRIGIKDEDSWVFSTTNNLFYAYNEKNPKILRLVNIFFRSSERGDAEVYNGFNNTWGSQTDNTNSSCSTGRQCRRFSNHIITKGRNPTADIGQQKIDIYFNLSLELGSESIPRNGQSPTLYEYIRGDFEQRQVYSNLPVTTTKPAALRKTTIRKR